MRHDFSKDPFAMATLFRCLDLGPWTLNLVPSYRISSCYLIGFCVAYDPSLTTDWSYLPILKCLYSPINHNNLKNLLIFGYKQVVDYCCKCSRILDRVPLVEVFLLRINWNVLNSRKYLYLKLIGYISTDFTP